MKILIVEDEDLAARHLQNMLQTLDDTLQITGILQSIEEFNQWFTSGGNADVIFCDIELRDGNVLNFLKTRPLNSVVIFITAYNQFWSEALSHHGIDYLLKPVSQEKLESVLQKISSLKRLFNGSEQQLLHQLSAYFQNRSSTSFKKRFPVRINNEVQIVDIADILFFRITQGVIFAHTNTHKKLPITEQTLNELENLLDQKMFFRINRAELVHINYIDSIQLLSQDHWVIKLKNSSEKLTLSASRVNQFKNWIHV